MENAITFIQVIVFITKTFADNPLHVSDAFHDNATYALVVKPNRSSQQHPTEAKPEGANDDHAEAGPSHQPAQDDGTYAQVVKPKRQRNASSPSKV